MNTNSKPRAEIDTTAPFGSVKEAVTHFGGSGSWVPLHLLRLAAATDHHHHHHHNGEEKLDIHKVEKQASELEEDLIVKERETLVALKQLEAAKQIVEGLKLKLIKEVSQLMSTTFNFSSDSPVSIHNSNEKPKGDFSIYPHVSSPNLILMELNEAKLNLSKTTNDLSAIQATVETLTKKMANSKTMLGESSNCGRILLSAEQNEHSERRDELQTSCVETKYVVDNCVQNTRNEVDQYSFEAEQFKKLEEAATYEVMKATWEIEQTKSSIKMVEMRLIAAKKIEEAARAMEAVALAKRDAISDEGIVHNPKPEGITLSYEEYSCLTQKAQKAEELSRIRNIDTTTSTMSKSDITEDAESSKRFIQKEASSKMGHTNRTSHVADEDVFCRGRLEQGSGVRYRNEPDHMSDETIPVLNTKISIGDILNQKLILQDDIMVGKAVEGNGARRAMSLSQMLRDQSGLILHPPKSAKNAHVEKQFVTQRKKFGFIHVSFPLTKHAKKI